MAKSRGISKREAEFALAMQRMEYRYRLQRLPLIAIVLAVPFGSAVLIAKYLAGQDTVISLSAQIAWGSTAAVSVSLVLSLRLAHTRKKKIQEQRERIDALEQGIIANQENERGGGS